jgi:hypothetical protein
MPEYTLMQHQSEGVKFLDSVDGIGALLWDPGVGKTGATAAWLDRLADKQREVRVLVVAPLTAADTWVSQPPMFMDSPVKGRMLQGSTLDILGKIKASRDWATVPRSSISADHPGERRQQVSGNRVTILSMSAGAVSSFCDQRPKTVQMLKAIRAYSPHVIVVDESHIIKSANANISKAMYQIGQLAPHRIILTGTVNPHSPLDVYGQWRFLAPWTFSDDYGKPHTKHPLTMTRMQQAAIRPWPWGRFLAHYATPGGYKGKGIGDFINLDDLNDRVAERAMVVRKADALDLPPTTDIDIHVTLSAEERAAYNQMHDELAAELETGELIEAPNALAKIMKLRQIAAGFVRNTETGEIHVVGDSLQKSMIEVIDTRLASEDRIVAFGYFRSECEALAAKLRKSNPGSVVEIITGSTPNKERLAIRRRFGDVSGNPQRTILVAQVRTMSLSVNELVSANHAVYGSPSERRVDWVQSRDRLDRKGQTKPVTFWNCYVPGTVGEVMVEKHKDRGDLEKALLDHIASTVRL